MVASGVIARELPSRRCCDALSHRSARVAILETVHVCELQCMFASGHRQQSRVVENTQVRSGLGVDRVIVMP